jgi:hypothetical protein
VISGATGDNADRPSEELTATGCGNGVFRLFGVYFGVLRVLLGLADTGGLMALASVVGETPGAGGRGLSTKCICGMGPQDGNGSTLTGVTIAPMVDMDKACGSSSTEATET